MMTHPEVPTLIIYLKQKKNNIFCMLKRNKRVEGNSYD